MLAVAEAARGDGVARHVEIVAGLEQIFREEAARQNWALGEEETLEPLRMDLELNAQAWGWLTAARPAPPVPEPARDFGHDRPCAPVRRHRPSFTARARPRARGRARLRDRYRRRRLVGRRRLRAQGGRLTPIDPDHVAESNINRQAHALEDTRSAWPR